MLLIFLQSTMGRALLLASVPKFIQMRSNEAICHLFIFWLPALNYNFTLQANEKKCCDAMDSNLGDPASIVLFFVITTHREEF